MVDTVNDRTPVRTMPGGVSLLGHTLRLVKQPLDSVDSLRDQGEVVVFRIGPRPAFMVSSGQLLKGLVAIQQSSFAKDGSPLEQTTVSRPQTETFNRASVGCRSRPSTTAG
ncbi:hypothetical protein ACFWA5_44875 [Streptomyces mirabilis]|uniref:hypothetical protein n=1 Tax=Streptomyces mirabilis TaxID=68239 RepID=UPI00365CAA49